MNCTIYNKNHHIVFTLNSSASRPRYHGSALQNPDLSRLSLGQMLRSRLKKVEQEAGSSLFWAVFRARQATSVANANQ